MLTVTAPAKINLTLEVLGKRPDGYHEIRSVLQTVSLCDTLRFESSDTVIFRSSHTEWSAEKSLISRTVSLLQTTAGIRKGVTITLEKNIPLSAGLGGDSSDAAATLRGLNELWELDLPREKLLALAAELGSDVSFFLYGGTALASGRGEQVTPIPPLSRHRVILIMPEISRLPGKTARLYASLGHNHFTDGTMTQKLAEAIKAGKEPAPLFNTFENVVFLKGSRMATYRSHLLKMGAREVHLAGSGPALYMLPKSEAEAADLAQRCRDQGMETYLVETLGL